MIKLGDKAGEPVGYENIIADIAYIPVIMDNNHLILKKNFEYI